MSDEPPRPLAPRVDTTTAETILIKVDADKTVRVEQTLRLVTLAPGQRVLNRYVLESVLGQGAMAVVWRARDEILGETVALKFLPETVARDVVAVEELKEETRRARRLTHPNIVRIHDFVQDATMAAVSMEYVEGDTLAKLRLEQPGKIFSVATLTPLITQLCGALDYAHATAKMAHRDIKPANLLVTRDGELKIADFGIARGMTEASTRLIAKAGGASGTLVYGSPQQLMGEKPLESDDIYAVGATLYELLTGKAPFFRDDAHSLIMQLRERAPIAMAERRAELEMTGEAIPPEWQQTILACLAKAPQDRPQSAREVAARLGLAEAGGGKREAKGRRVESGAASSPYRWIVAAAALVMLGLAGYFFWPKAGRVIFNAPPATAAFSREFIVTVDPVSSAARLSLGPFVDVEVKAGRAVLKDLPDGEHELTVHASGFQPFATRVTVTAGRGRAEVRLSAAKGIFEITARPGTRITAVDAQGREVRLGAVAAGGVLASGNLLTVGRYTLKLEHPDCGPVELANVQLKADRVTKLAPAQIPLPGELRVFSVPTGAEVRVNGDVAGKTPATLKNRPSEKPLRVEVVARGYRKTEQTLTLRPKEVRTVNVGTLVATVSGIEFRNLPAGFSLGSAKVLIDGREMKPRREGDAWRIDGLESGARLVEVLNPDYEPWKQTVTVEDRETAVVEVNPLPRQARLSLTVQGASSYSLFANGREIPIKDGTAVLPPGEALALEVRAKGFSSAMRTLTAKPNGSENWEVKLEKLVPPRLGQPWENTLGMKFAPVPGTGVLFSIWDTRVQDYERFVSATRRNWPKPNFEQGSTHPAVNMSWEDAQAFCAWLTQQEQAAGGLGPDQKYRLPTDAEWSIAVGLGRESGNTPQEKSGRIQDVYPWGTQWPPPRGAGNYAGEESSFPAGGKIAGYNDGYTRTSPVGSFAANKFGLYDMGGNVSQWCEDFYDGSSGPRVLRGAPFFAFPKNRLLSSFRDGRTPVPSNNGYYGFRCVVAVASEAATTSGGAVPATKTAPAPPAVGKLRGPQTGQPWENTLGMKFVPVPGTDTLFCIWETRVQDYAAFAQATRRGWTKSGPASASHPAGNVSWDDAQAFCQWLTQKERAAGRLGSDKYYRLPTIAEWAAAVGPGQYPWGDEWPPPQGAGNYNRSLKVDNYDGAAPVGSFAANRYGIYDLGGNVWEWGEDFSDGSSEMRMLRGASSGSPGDENSLKSRGGHGHGRPPDSRNGDRGFRCVVAVVAPETAATSGGEAPARKTVPTPVTVGKLRGPEVGQPWTVPDLGLVLQPIAAGSFQMGSTNGEANERPQTRVTLTQPFWLGRTEVTQREWSALMGNNPSGFKGDDRPVAQVSWDEAMTFCRKLTERERAAGRLPDGYAYTLPTEAQWEYACRAGTTGVYAGNLDDMAWYDKNSGSTTHPVGQKRANAWGLYDMHGNVWEWCFDIQTNQYPGGSVSDYTGPASGSGRVIRGGCWSVTADWCRSAFRGWRGPDFRGGGLGFRLALAAVNQTNPSSPSVSFAIPDAQRKSPPTLRKTEQPQPARPWENTLGMKFVPVPGTGVLFCIWETRVQDFEAFVNATGHDATNGMFTIGSDRFKRRGDTWKSPGFAQGPTHPVCGVNYDDAMAFCRWLTQKEQQGGTLKNGQRYRLPTDEEWSRAVGLDREVGSTPPEKAQANRNTFPWGTDWPPPAGAGNFAGSEAVDAKWPSERPIIQGYRDDYPRPAPVGSFSPNRYGLYDLAGNVWELCEDCFDGTGQWHVVRGGSWNNSRIEELASSTRDPSKLGGRHDGYGFRCVVEVAGAPEASAAVANAATPALAPANADLRRTPPAGFNWTFTGGPRGGIGYDVRIHPVDHNILWVTDANAGVHRSINGGTSWTSMNLGITARTGFSGDAIPIFSLTIDQNHPDTIWVGTLGMRGVFKTVDGGKMWFRMEKGIEERSNMEIRAFTVDPKDSNIVYMGGNYKPAPKKMEVRGVIYKTTDGGKQWTKILEPGALVRWIVIDPTNTNILYASTGIFDRIAIKPEGILKSTDGGRTWFPINEGLTSLSVGGLVMDPQNSQVLFATTGKASAFLNEPRELYGAVFKTIDGGKQWRKVYPVGRDIKIRYSAIAFAPSNPNIVYADAGPEFLRSADGGETWQRYDTSPKGENRGQPIALAVHPRNPDLLYMNAYDGGVFRSDDGGKKWVDASVGYSGAQAWDIAVSPSNPNYVVVGSKNGVHVSFDGGSNWQGRNTSGYIQNMRAVAIDPTAPERILIGRGIDGHMHLSTDGGQKWQTALPPVGADTPTQRIAINQIAFAPAQPSIVYAASSIESMTMMLARDTKGGGVFKSTDGGRSWLPVNRGLESVRLNTLALAVHPRGPNIVYVGTLDGGVFKTTDGGGTWFKSNQGIPVPKIRALAIDPSNPEVVYAGSEDAALFKSVDGGKNWRQSSAGMNPESAICSIVIDPSGSQIVYAADARSGVYRSTDSGKTWGLINQGLRVRAVNRLAISADGKLLYAATEGGGVFRIGRPQITPTP